MQRIAYYARVRARDSISVTGCRHLSTMAPGEIAKANAHVEKTPITGELWEQRRKLLKLGLQFDGVGSRQQTVVMEKTVAQSRMSIR
jgi:hypothetical protein